MSCSLSAESVWWFRLVSGLSVSQWLYQQADVNSTCLIPGLWDKGIMLETPVVTVPQSVTMRSEDSVHCCDTLSSRVWKLKKPYIYIYIYI